MLQKISEHVYRFRDTCNVYVLCDGREAVLIDFGSGDVLDHLPAVGVERVAGVLMTHHHRDQGQGLARAAEKGIRIFVPHAEQELFHSVNEHWQAREVYNNYNVRQDRFSILESVPVAGTLKDYAAYTFGSIGVRVLPTPGHTAGSVTLLARLDGKHIAFSGDLMAAPGKVWSMAATQWTYNGAEGAAYSVLSLQSLKEVNPDWILPSHGEPITEPSRAADLLIGRLQRLLELRGQYAHLADWRERPYEPITPHLLRNRTCMANSYVVLSQSGKALLIDYGYDFNAGLAAGPDRSARRPWLYSVEALKRQYGVRKIDVVMPTHYHDDHVAGFNLLRDVEGAEVWAAENFADLLEHPSRYDVPCLWYDPIPVDRRLPIGRPIRWEEYEFTLYEQPGHTLYAVAISFEADGKRVLAIGDQQGNDDHLWNYVYKNRFRIGDYVQSAELYSKLGPDLIISGHWEPLWVQPGYLEMLKKNGEALEALHKELLPLDDIDLGAEGFCAWIRPYQITAKSGETVNLQVEVINPFGHEAEIALSFIVPRGWEADRRGISMPMQPHAAAAVDFSVRIPAGITARRARVAVDVTAGHIRLGQQADALITVKPPQ